jgi:mono/diheme cytochrome c family protein
MLMNFFQSRSRATIVSSFFAGLFLILLQGTSGQAQEAEVVAAGKAEFRRHCALCHGIGGKGDSIMMNLNLLAEKPPNLTQLSKTNGGTFPFWQVYRIIDGRQPVKGHGTLEMPIWGDLWSMQEESGGFTAETKTAGRILNIVHYLQSIQEK